MLCPGFSRRPNSCCSRFCNRMRAVFRSATCRASSSACALLAQFAGGDGICKAVIAGASGSGSKSSSKPGKRRYQRTRLKASTRAASSVPRGWPGNLCRTPKRSISNSAWQRSPSHSVLQWTSEPPHSGQVRRRPSRSAEPPSPRLGATGRPPPCCMRSTSPQLPTKKLRERSAASRCASFFEGRQPPATWCGRPSSTNATTARNSRVMKFSMRVSNPHCRIGRCCGAWNCVEHWTNSWSSEMGPLPSSPSSFGAPWRWWRWPW
mmetsp:Transcript_30256/g.95449  ORF Transcript_30256/g.95449 Transcript_30256/m.95449 type:complete len:264 (-) Transcript_30256:188-979(-)